VDVDNAVVPARSSILVSLGMLGVGTAAAALALVLIRPFEAGPAAADAAASVLYFERIVSREPLDAWVNTTPKPLLTVVYGLLHAGGDWRPISWATIAAWAAGVSLGALIGLRERGWPAAAFAAVAVAGTGPLLAQVSWANPLPWAYPLWLVALLALSAGPPRYGLAGVALLLAGLVRLETLMFVALATAALLVAAVLRLTGRSTAPTNRRAALVLLGWLAIPLMCVHDWLLAGEPTYWLEVARRYAESIEVRDAGWVTELVIGRITTSWPIAVLALVGLADLLLRRRWLTALALVTAAGGTVAVLYAFTFRGLQVLRYYSDPIELALLLAAAIGVGALAGRIAAFAGSARRPIPGDGTRATVAATASTPSRSPAAAGTAAGVVVAGLLAAALVWPRSIFRPDFADGMRRYTDLAANLDAMRPALLGALDDLPAARVLPARAGTALVASPDTAVLLTPSQMETRMAIDLGLPLARVAVLPTSRVDPANGWPRDGQLVYVDARDGRPTSGYFRSTTPRPIGGLVVVPLIAEQRPGVWLSRVERSGAGEQPIDSAGATAP
jgi:hypothetical protein